MPFTKFAAMLLFSNIKDGNFHRLFLLSNSVLLITEMKEYFITSYSIGRYMIDVLYSVPPN